MSWTSLLCLGLPLIYVSWVVYMRYIPSIQYPPVVICLVGEHGSGKDTVAGMLAAHHSFAHIAFADALRDVCADILHTICHVGDSPQDAMRYLTEPARKEKSIVPGNSVSPTTPAPRKPYTLLGNEIFTPRRLLQFVGEGLRRHLFADIWAQKVCEQVRFLCTESHKAHMHPRIVISDLRLSIEMDTVLEQLPETAIFEVWRVCRTHRGHDLRRQADRHVTDVSARKLSWTKTIANDGSLSELARSVNEAVRDIRVRLRARRGMMYMYSLK